MKRKSSPAEAIAPDDIARVICSVRGQRVILDSDLASLYGVSTKRLNQQMRRNLERFPKDFAFQLTAEEWERFKATWPVNSGQSMRLQFATASKRNLRYLPFVFTEHGALQAANILNSPRAVAMSLYVIRAFVKMREELASNGAILKRLGEIERDLLIHDTALRDVYEKLLPLLAPPEADGPPKEIGFHAKEDPIPYRIRRKPARL